MLAQIDAQGKAFKKLRDLWKKSFKSFLLKNLSLKIEKESIFVILWKGKKVFIALSSGKALKAFPSSWKLKKLMKTFKSFPFKKVSVEVKVQS